MTNLFSGGGEMGRLMGALDWAATPIGAVEERLRVLAAGFQHYVTKPVDPDELVDVVARLGGAAPRE